jgi:hypothetical protein
VETAARSDTLRPPGAPWPPQSRIRLTGRPGRIGKGFSEDDAGADPAFGPYRLRKYASSSRRRYPNRAGVMAMRGKDGAISRKLA